MPHTVKGFQIGNYKYGNFSTLVGPTVTRTVQDPLAVTRLENQLYMLVLEPWYYAKQL